MSSTTTIHYAMLSAIAMATLLLSATFGAPLPGSDGPTETRSRRSENPILCYTKTDQQLKEQLANSASDITEEIIVIPIRVGDATIKVGAMRQTLQILSKQNCSLCIDSTLDYDSNRFPQYLLVTRVVETHHCTSLFLNNNSHSVTVLRREGGCSSDGEEIWEATKVRLQQIDYQYHDDVLC